MDVKVNDELLKAAPAASIPPELRGLAAIAVADIVELTTKGGRSVVLQELNGLEMLYVDRMLTMESLITQPMLRVLYSIRRLDGAEVARAQHVKQLEALAAGFRSRDLTEVVMAYNEKFGGIEEPTDPNT